MNTTKFEKLKSSLRYRLMGLAMADSRYFKVLEAFEFAADVHQGFRKDGKTPEFEHQLNMLGFAMTLHNSLVQPHKVYINVLLHDTYEDADKFVKTHPNLIVDMETTFAEDMVHIKRISKIIHQRQPDGSYVQVKKDLSVYFDDMASCVICSITKPIDRTNNMSTMKGVFNLEKQKRYTVEVDDYFLPMLKKARRAFPQQELVYEQLKSVLNLLKANIQHFVDILMGGENVYELKEAK